MYGITGEPIYFAAGGVGSGFYNGANTSESTMNGGATNGSAGYHPSIGTGPITTTVNNNAVNYTGSGGGGGRTSGDAGGLGGNGIIVLRWYPTQT
jgi:hypothetical protein